MRVLLQAGHYPDGGGAPGEAAWTYRLALGIAEWLTAAGIDTVIVGDWYGKTPPPATRETWDLFVSLHYDAAIYADRGERNSGCFADRAALDPVAAQSDRFVALWESQYPQVTGIPLTPQRRNAKTSDYYGFAATTNETPGVILEHGCGAPVPVGRFPAGEDADYLHAHLQDVAQADAESIMAYLGAPMDPFGPVQLTPPLTEAERALVDLHRAIAITREGVELLISRNGRAAEIGAALAQSRMSSGQRRAYGRELAAWADAPAA